jgi:hypothetical protein
MVCKLCSVKRSGKPSRLRCEIHSSLTVEGTGGTGHDYCMRFIGTRADLFSNSQQIMISNLGTGGGIKKVSLESARSEYQNTMDIGNLHREAAHHGSASP